MSGSRVAVSYLGVASSTVVLGTVSTALSLLSLGRNHGTRLVPKVWGRIVLASCGVKMAVRGLERFDHDRQFIFASNHQSLLDPPIVLCAAPQKIRFVAKRSLFYVPIFGQAIWAAGNVPIDRGRTETTTRKLREVGRKVGRDLSILFFPEGTRSADGALLPFKRGAAVMALQTGLALLPVAVAGTGTLLPKGARTVTPGVAGVAFGEPIEVAGCDLPDREALTASLRAAVEKLMPEAEGARRSFSSATQP